MRSYSLSADKGSLKRSDRFKQIMSTKLGLIPCDWLIIVFLHLLHFFPFFFFCPHSLSVSGTGKRRSAGRSNLYDSFWLNAQASTSLFHQKMSSLFNFLEAQ